MSRHFLGVQFAVHDLIVDAGKKCHFMMLKDIELFQCHLLSSNVFNTFISWQGKRCFQHQDCPFATQLPI
jgi:hypothetical protein